MNPILPELFGALTAFIILLPFVLILGLIPLLFHIIFISPYDKKTDEIRERMEKRNEKREEERLAKGGEERYLDW